jgi:hypothetical protein
LFAFFIRYQLVHLVYWIRWLKTVNSCIFAWFFFFLKKKE